MKEDSEAKAFLWSDLLTKVKSLHSNFNEEITSSKQQSQDHFQSKLQPSVSNVGKHDGAKGDALANKRSNFLKFMAGRGDKTLKRTVSADK